MHVWKNINSEYQLRILSSRRHWRECGKAAPITIIPITMGRPLHTIRSYWQALSHQTINFSVDNILILQKLPSSPALFVHTVRGCCPRTCCCTPFTTFFKKKVNETRAQYVVVHVCIFDMLLWYVHSVNVIPIWYRVVYLGHMQDRRCCLLPHMVCIR